MTHTHAKGQGQRSLGSKVKTDGKTDGRTEAIALPPVLTRSAVLKFHESSFLAHRTNGRYRHIGFVEPDR